jgi:hypothetical protein
VQIVKRRPAVVAGLVLLAGLAPLAADRPGGDEWKYDVVHRKGGLLPLRGLVVDQGTDYVRVKCISRKPGSPTIVIPENVPKKDVAKLELLEGKERDLLRGRLEALQRERAALARHLKLLDPKRKGVLRSGDAVDLRRAPWPPDPKVKGLLYQSAHFRLVSNARAEVVQLAAIHLEQIYAAYVRALPPRTKKAEPTTVLLTRSLADYQELARKRGLVLANPAFYDPARNQVVCGSDLERLCDEREKVREHHARLRVKIKERKDALAKVYRKKVPPELLAPLAEAEKKIAQADKGNDEKFGRVQDRLFQRLYHEAFHAYLSTFVYPDRDGPLPLWFNEGLAQVFESAIVEVGELRVGHADPERYKEVRRALAKGTLLPLKDLLRSENKHFLVAHGGDRQAPDRYYLASWALAFHLTFERKLLGTRALDDYVQALKRGTDPLLAFRDLVGQPLDAFEKQYLKYLQKLRLDGTAGP